jgi:hypothetical protein
MLLSVCEQNKGEQVHSRAQARRLNLIKAGPWLRHRHKKQSFRCKPTQKRPRGRERWAMAQRDCCRHTATKQTAHQKHSVAHPRAALPQPAQSSRWMGTDQAAEDPHTNTHLETHHWPPTLTSHRLSRHRRLKETNDATRPLAPGPTAQVRASIEQRQRENGRRGEKHSKESTCWAAPVLAESQPPSLARDLE